MTRSKLWALCALFALTLSLPAISQRATDPSGASLAIPAGWTQSEPGHGASLVLYAPDPFADFRPNVNLMVQNSGSMSLEEYYRISVEEVSQAGGRTEDYEAVTLDDGTPAHRMVLHMQLQGRQLSCLSVWVVKGGKTYLVTGTSTSEDFPNRQDSFWQVAKTLRTEPPRGGPVGGAEQPFPTGFGSGR